MKSTLALTAIALLAVLTLVGCNQNTTDNGSSGTSATNSGMSGASSGSTNLPATNSTSQLHTNI